MKSLGKYAKNVFMHERVKSENGQKACVINGTKEFINNP
jgi:hypothetical protein